MLALRSSLGVYELKTHNVRLPRGWQLSAAATSTETRGKFYGGIRGSAELVVIPRVVVIPKHVVFGRRGVVSGHPWKS